MIQPDAVADGAGARLEKLIAEPELARLLAALNGAGQECRVVGGAVRNAILGLTVRDIDCATTAVPAETIRRAAAAGFRTIPTGIDHGTVTVMVEGHSFEVTTLREDVETDGRHALVRFGTDFAADARRRDFTVNALTLDAAGRLHDDIGGLVDLAARRIRFIGDADRRIREDYLRILRFFRFHGEYGEGPLDRDGRDASARGLAGLDRLSRERVRAEMVKLVVSRGAGAVLLAMQDTGVLGRILGGNAEHGRFGRVSTVAQAAPLRLAALAAMVPDDVARLRERLKLSNGETALMKGFAGLAVELKGSCRVVTRAALRAIVYRHGIAVAQAVFAALDGEPGIALDPEALQEMNRLASGAQLPPLPFDGRTMLDLGIAPGPAMGEAIRRAERAWLEAGLPSDEADIAAIAARAAQGA